MAQDAQTTEVVTEAAVESLDLSLTGLQALLPKAQGWLIDKGPSLALKIVAALVVFWIGSAIAKRISNSINKQAVSNPKVDTTLGKLGASVVRYGILIASALIAVSILGVKVAAIMSIFAAMALAIGLALQGSMSNVAAGLLLLVLRPYNVGDFVELAGQEGTVEDLNIFTTTLRTMDNVQVIISNGEVRGSTVKNLTSLGKRRVDVDFGIDYNDNIDTAIDIIKSTASQDSRVLTNPEGPWAKVAKLNDSSVDIQMRVWCKPEDYWDVRFDLIKDVKEAFDKGGISIPYPHCVEIEK